MVSEDAIAVMRKIAKPSRGPSAHSGMNAGRAWRVSLPKAAEEAIGLVASVKTFETEVVPLDALFAECGENLLVASLAGPDGAQGLVIADEALLAGLVEVQTTGRVQQTPPPERAPSDTDLALFGHVVDRWIADQERALADGGSPVPYRGFRVAERMKDARAVSLHLDEGDYALSRMTIDLALGARVGGLVLAYPKGAARRSDAAAGGAGGGAAAEIVLESEADLSAVLVRLQMSVGQLSALEPGLLLPVARSTISKVRLEDLGGNCVSLARLGQSGGHRAVLLLSPDARDVAQNGGASAGLAAGPGLAGADIAPMELPGADRLAQDAAPLGNATAPEGSNAPPLGGADGDPPALDAGDIGDLPDIDTDIDMGGAGDLPRSDAQDKSDVPDIAIAPPGDLPPLG